MYLGVMFGIFLGDFKCRAKERAHMIGRCS
jgi:hypothetical protein